MTFKKGQRVLTPDGHGKIIEIDIGIENVRYLVCLETDKFWPHWNIYYQHEALSI